MNITEEEFSQIIKENEDRLNHLSRVYADRADEQQDIFQEIIIQIWNSLPSFNGEANIDTWIYRLAVNTAISFVRKKETRRDYYSDYKDEKDSQEDTNHLYDDKNEKLEILYDAISNLNASEKAIITMYLEDFSYSEIAFVTDITENYVGVKLNRIKKKLSNIIEENYEVG